MPRVSVVIPAYNAASYLAEAISSILTQSYNDFELLIMDDGSTDSTFEIAQRAAALDPRVIAAQGGHRGIVHTMNACVRMVRGELVARMDADDISSPHRLARQVEYLDRHSECCIAGTQALRVDPEGAPISLWRVPELHEAIDARHMAGRPGGIVNPSVMMRRSALERVGGYRLGFEPAEDYDLFLRIAEIGRMANLPDVLLQYRVHERCATFTHAEEQTRHTRRALQEAWVRRQKAGYPSIPENEHRTPTLEELIWSWARSAFKSGYFKTAAKQSLRFARRRPWAAKAWALCAASLIRQWGQRVAFWRKLLKGCSSRT